MVIIFCCSLDQVHALIFIALQDDVVMGTLTVRENLMFSANLRLPNSVSQKDKRQRVEDTLQELGLTSCADTKVSHISCADNIMCSMLHC